MKLLTLPGFLIIAVSMCAAFHLRAGGLAFKAEGILQQYNGSNLGQTYDFAALVDDCRWLIHTVPQNSPGLEYYEDSYDGAYIYHYLQFAGILQRNAANSSGGEIVASDIPNNKADYVVATWLAYGSSCYFDKVKEDKVKPFFDWFEPNASELNKLVAVDLKRSDKPPFMPTFIYAKDFNRRYRVIEFTNFHGMLLPKEFVIECFQPYSEIGTNPPVFSFRGMLKDIELVSGELSIHDFQPKLDGKTYTVDFRFSPKTSDALTYMNKSNQWLSTNNPQLVALHHQRLSDQPSEINVSQSSRLFVLILLACPTVAFVLFAVFHWKRSRKNMHETSV